MREMTLLGGDAWFAGTGADDRGHALFVFLLSILLLALVEVCLPGVSNLLGLGALVSLGLHPGIQLGG